MMPTFLLRYLPHLAVLAVLAAIAGGIYYQGYQSGDEAVRIAWNAEKLERAEAQLQHNLEMTEKLKSLEETKNANLTEIDRLRANNHALWLRLPKTPCGGSGEASGNSTAASGVVHVDVPSSAETAVNEFDATYRDEAYRADKLIEGCRVINDLTQVR